MASLRMMKSLMAFLFGNIPAQGMKMFQPGPGEIREGSVDEGILVSPVQPSAKWREDMRHIKTPDSHINDLSSFLNASLSHCSCAQASGGCVVGTGTIVTGILSVCKPGRSFGDYVKHLRALVKSMPDFPLIDFCGARLRKGHFKRTSAR